MPNVIDDVFAGDLIYVTVFCLAGLALTIGPIAVVLFLSPRRTRNT
jgi:hypothetical protein